jgi:hypothetical protein
MQASQDQFHPGHLMLRMNVHRHPAAVVLHRERAIRMKDHIDPRRKAADRFIHTVVDHLLGKMIRTGGVGVHARALAHWLKARQYLNGTGIILMRNRFSHNDNY